ncbi:MAG: zf-HC2 domain-containing protein [Planctomycetes bacterium]|nr:zf-HC2 domain-containing protein [Planctomycetota bacterium]
MDCEKCRELLSEYIDGRLSVETSAALAAHLEECAECRALEGQLRATIALVAGLEKKSAPGDFADGVTAQLEREMLLEGPARPRKSRIVPWSLAGAGFAAAAVFLAMLCIWNPPVEKPAPTGDTAGTVVALSDDAADITVKTRDRKNASRAAARQIAAARIEEEPKSITTQRRVASAPAEEHYGQLVERYAHDDAEITAVREAGGLKAGAAGGHPAAEEANAPVEVAAVTDEARTRSRRMLGAYKKGDSPAVPKDAAITDLPTAGALPANGQVQAAGANEAVATKSAGEEYYWADQTEHAEAGIRKESAAPEAAGKHKDADALEKTAATEGFALRLDKSRPKEAATDRISQSAETKKPAVPAASSRSETSASKEVAETALRPEPDAVIALGVPVDLAHKAPVSETVPEITFEARQGAIAATVEFANSLLEADKRLGAKPALADLRSTLKELNVQVVELSDERSVLQVEFPPGTILAVNRALKNAAGISLRGKLPVDVASKVAAGETTAVKEETDEKADSEAEHTTLTFGRIRTSAASGEPVTLQYIFIHRAAPAEDFSSAAPPSSDDASIAQEAPEDH